MPPETVELDGMRVLVRGWLDGNVVHIGSDVIDSGYHSGAAELSAWLDAPVHNIFLTHVHSDHAGGVAALRERGAVRVHGHPAAIGIVEPWNPERLWLTGTDQVLPRFRIDHPVNHGDTVTIGGRPFEVISVPGHATGGVAYLSDQGTVVTGDALWENGFGILRPEVDGPQVFDEAALALDRIERARPKVVIPGHGMPFEDIEGALSRARSLLDRLRDPVELRKRQHRALHGFRALLQADS